MPERLTAADYESARADFRLEIPEFYNFGFDVIDRRAAQADKTAFIAVDAGGARIEHHSFSDLRRDSNRFANLLLETGAAKGDFALVMIRRIPAWYHVLVGCIKTGVVAMPGTTLLTAKDIAYRINKAGASIAIVTPDHADKVEDVRARCPTLEHLILVGGERRGWVGFEAASSSSDRLSRDDVAPTRSDEMMLAYFTSGTTAMPKLVPRDHAYALAHTITARYWMDLVEDDVHWTLSDTGWAKAAWGMLFPPWLVGAATVLYDGAPGFDGEAHLRVIERLKVTTFCAPPTVYRILAQTGIGGFDLGSIRHSFGAGEPLNPEAIRVWKGDDRHRGP